MDALSSHRASERNKVAFPIGLPDLYSYYFFIFFNIYLFLRERVGEEQRERETEDPKWALHRQQRSRCRAQTHKL